MRNVVDRCTKFAVLCDESFLISKKDIKKSVILRAITNEVFGFKKRRKKFKMKKKEAGREGNCKTGTTPFVCGSAGNRCLQNCI